MVEMCEGKGGKRRVTTPYYTSGLHPAKVGWNQSKFVDVNATPLTWNLGLGMLKLSPISYYLGSGLFFIAGSAIVYNGWDYYTPRQDNKIVCVANPNVNLLAFLWLVQGILLLACCISFGIFTTYESKSARKTFLVTYSALFLKVCPKVVKILQLFNFCQLFAIVFDLMVLPECNSTRLRYLFAIVIGINWFVAIWGILLRRGILLPPFLYDPASLRKGYFTNLQNFIEPMGI